MSCLVKKVNAAIFYSYLKMSSNKSLVSSLKGIKNTKKIQAGSGSEVGILKTESGIQIRIRCKGPQFIRFFVLCEISGFFKHMLFHPKKNIILVRVLCVLRLIFV